MALGQAQRPIESDDPSKKAHLSGPEGEREIHVRNAELLAEQQKTNALLEKILGFMIEAGNR